MTLAGCVADHTIDGKFLSGGKLVSLSFRGADKTFYLYMRMPEGVAGYSTGKYRFISKNKILLQGFSEQDIATFKNVKSSISSVDNGDSTTIPIHYKQDHKDIYTVMRLNDSVLINIKKDTSFTAPVDVELIAIRSGIDFLRMRSIITPVVDTIYTRKKNALNGKKMQIDLVLEELDFYRCAINDTAILKNENEVDLDEWRFFREGSAVPVPE